MKGYISSIQSMGTLDGPGVRFVAFLQGCNLRCGCCHNPETQELSGGEEYTPLELVEKAFRFKNFFGKEGGITLSGGEPLLQAEFSAEVFKICREKGIDTCLDTSGSLLNEKVKNLLSFTDRVLLDIKYPTDELYKKYVGCGITAPLEFLKFLNEQKIPTTLRQVIIPTLNDNEESINFLKELKEKYKGVENIELLPFKKLCEVKYENLGREFPFKDISVPTSEQMEKLNNILK